MASSLLPFSYGLTHEAILPDGLREARRAMRRRMAHSRLARSRPKEGLNIRPKGIDNARTRHCWPASSQVLHRLRHIDAFEPGCDDGGISIRARGGSKLWTRKIVKGQVLSTREHKLAGELGTIHRPPQRAGEYPCSVIMLTTISRSLATDLRLGHMPAPCVVRCLGICKWV